MEQDYSYFHSDDVICEHCREFRNWLDNPWLWVEVETGNTILVRTILAFVAGILVAAGFAMVLQ